MRFLSYSNVVSTIALCLAVGGGSAYAAGLIKGNQIAKKTITGANIKPRTLTSSHFKTQINAAPGAPGAKGDQGPQGPAGPQGATGPAGSVVMAKADVFFQRTNIPEFYRSTNVGFPPNGLSNPQTGVVCIKPPAWYDAAIHVAHVTTANGFGSTYIANQCGGDMIQVVTRNWDGDPFNTSFVITIQ